MSPRFITRSINKDNVAGNREVKERDGYLGEVNMETEPEGSIWKPGRLFLATPYHAFTPCSWAQGAQKQIPSVA